MSQIKNTAELYFNQWFRKLHFLLKSKLEFYLCSTARGHTGHALSIVTCGSQTHTEVTACD